MTDGATGASFRQTTFPFGTTVSAETTGNTNEVFTSYDRSAGTGLDYAHNRTYSKGQGRFTQVDPFGTGAATVVDPQSHNLYAYTQNMPTDSADPSGLNMVIFSHTECDVDLTWLLETHGGVRYTNCREVVDHIMNIPDGDPGGDREPGGPGGGTEPPPAKKPACHQHKDGGDNPVISGYLDAAGLSADLVPVMQSETSSEGYVFYTADAGQLLARINADSRFLYDTGLGREHVKDVGKNNVDNRSRLWTGPGLGAAVDGTRRSLQVTVGEADSTGGAFVYVDVDCINPAEGALPMVLHGVPIGAKRFVRFLKGLFGGK